MFCMHPALVAHLHGHQWWPACAQAQQRASGAGAAPREQPDALQQDKERRVRADWRLKRLHEQQEAARHLASIGAPGSHLTPGLHGTRSAQAKLPHEQEEAALTFANMC